MTPIGPYNFGKGALGAATRAEYIYIYTNKTPITRTALKDLTRPGPEGRRIILLYYYIIILFYYYSIIVYSIIILLYCNIII